MKTLLFVLLLFVRTVFAMLRRLTLGPRRAGWNMPAELVQTTVRTALVATRWWGFPWLRDLQSLSRPRAEVLEEVEFEPVDAAGVACEWCRPKHAPCRRSLLYLHGGGYVIGSVDDYRELIAQLALRANAQVLAPNYRLAPENGFPSANEDCVAVYRWLLDRGVEPAHTAIAGDSAGGGLCVDLLLTARDNGLPLPAAALLFSPWLDPLAEGGSLLSNEPYDTIDRRFLASCIETYMAGENATHPRVSLLRADLSGLPPLRIAVGTDEVLLDQDREFARAAASQGVDATLAEYQDCFHTFQNFSALIPSAERALADCCRFLEERVPARDGGVDDGGKTP